MKFNKNVRSIAEQDEVSRIITDGYAKGILDDNFDTIMTSFHPDATMYGIFDGELLPGSIRNLAGYCEKFGAGEKTGMIARLDVLDMTTTTAVVRIDIENAPCGSDYTDYHSLIKLDGKWQIVSKLFHQYDRK